MRDDPDIHFASRAFRVANTEPSVPLDGQELWDFALEVAVEVTHPAGVPLGPGPLSRNSEAPVGPYALGVAGENLRRGMAALDFEHDSGIDVPVLGPRGRVAPMPCLDTYDEALEQVGSFDELQDVVAEILSWSLWFVIDLVAALVQTAFRFDDEIFIRWHRISEFPEEERNAARTADLVERLRPVLAERGWSIDGRGHVGEIDGPEPWPPDSAAWHAAEASVQEALRETRDGRYGDALTDLGRAVQQAFTATGFPGKTLGEQASAARTEGAFSGAHSLLGEAADQLVRWIAAQRNQHSDAHPSDERLDQATLVTAVAATRAVMAHLRRIGRPVAPP